MREFIKLFLMGAAVSGSCILLVWGMFALLVAIHPTARQVLWGFGGVMFIVFSLYFGVMLRWYLED